MPTITVTPTLENGRAVFSLPNGVYPAGSVKVKNLSGTTLLTHPPGFTVAEAPAGLLESQYFGDSTTFGATAANPATEAYPAVLKTIHDPAIYNVNTIGVGQPYGRSGRNTNDMIIEIMQPLFSNPPVAQSAFVAGKTNIGVVYLGINDATGGLALSEVSANFDTIFSGFKTIGWQKLVQIIPGFVQTGGTETDAALQTGLPAQWAIRQDILDRAPARQVNKVIDLLTVARNTLGLYNATYWNSDRVHYNAAGYALLAQIVKDQMATL